VGLQEVKKATGTSLLQSRYSNSMTTNVLTELVTAAAMLLYSEGSRFEPWSGYPEMILMYLSLRKQDTWTVCNILNLSTTV
jgi:glutaredoxin-related protein